MKSPKQTQWTKGIFIQIVLWEISQQFFLSLVPVASPQYLAIDGPNIYCTSSGSLSRRLRTGYFTKHLDVVPTNERKCQWHGRRTS